jgi:hypothetical protein
VKITFKKEFYFSTDCLFSPDDQLIVTGVSVKKNEGKGKLLFLDRESLDIMTQLEVSDTVSCIFFTCLLAYFNVSLFKTRG